MENCNFLITIFLVVIFFNAEVYCQDLSLLSVTAQSPIDGSLAEEGNPNFMVDLDMTDIVDLDLTEIDIGDPGWIWVKNVLREAPKFKSVSGVVDQSYVTHTDFPAAHDSHDMCIYIKVDKGQSGVLSNVGKPNNAEEADNFSSVLTPSILEVEWETGTFPNERQKKSPERYFPKWVWPSVGDRIWVNGHWVFDLGHPKRVNGKNYYRTEIHPPRAVATMRNQAYKMPGRTGKLLPVRVTATDLYIHGRAGYVVDILNCGPEIMLSDDPNSCPTKNTPINEDFEFDIILPPKPVKHAKLVKHILNGPSNSLNIEPIFEYRLDEQPAIVHVIIPLAGTNATPSDVYARRIYFGWDDSNVPEMRQYKVTLNKMDLHNDYDLDPGDGELTFVWLNVGSSPVNEWIRLVDFAEGNMNDYDDDGGWGNGEITFSGAEFIFWIPQVSKSKNSFIMRARGYEQDCYDDYYGNHSFNAEMFLNCHIGEGVIYENGDNERIDDFDVLINASSLKQIGDVAMYDVTADQPYNRPKKSGGDYELEFTVELLDIIPENNVNNEIIIIRRNERVISTRGDTTLRDTVDSTLRDTVGTTIRDHRK